MKNRVLLLTLIILATSLPSAYAQEQLLGSFAYEDGTFWEREYTDGSFDSNKPFTTYEIQVPSSGVIEFTIHTEYDSTDDPLIPGAAYPLPHGVNILVSQPDTGQDPLLDPMAWIPDEDGYSVESGRVFVAVYPVEYFIGGIMDESEGPNYDETTFDYLNVQGNIYYTFTPTGGIPSTEPADVIDHIICGEVTMDNTPVDVRNSFTPDETVHSVLNLANIHAGDIVTWTYSGPNDVTAMSGLEFDEAGDYNAYSTLDLTEYVDPAGEWFVSIDINGNLMRADTFIVEGRTGVGIPLPGWMAAIGVAFALKGSRRRNED